MKTKIPSPCLTRHFSMANKKLQKYCLVPRNGFLFLDPRVFFFPDILAICLHYGLLQLFESLYSTCWKYFFKIEGTGRESAGIGREIPPVIAVGKRLLPSVTRGDGIRRVSSVIGGAVVEDRRHCG